MFDEATRIGRSLTSLRASGLLDDRLELVLVDDGSTRRHPRGGRSGSSTSSASIERTVVRLGDATAGKGAAVRAGMLAATGATRVFVDADLCVGADDIERCFAHAWRPASADVVYGTRAHAHSALDQQPARLPGAVRAACSTCCCAASGSPRSSTPSAASRA